MYTWLLTTAVLVSGSLVTDQNIHTIVVSSKHVEGKLNPGICPFSSSGQPIEHAVGLHPGTRYSLQLWALIYFQPFQPLGQQDYKVS